MRKCVPEEIKKAVAPIIKEKYEIELELSELKRKD